METIDLDLDSSFEPQFRARSNTWPLPRPDMSDSLLSGPPPDIIEETIKVEGGLGLLGSGSRINLLDGNTANGDIHGDHIIPTTANDTSLDQTAGQNGHKKNTSRRNAWGNMSYADLITQAIQSSPESRLTLSQIYDWMVQNVPYFKDKGDSNSSAGWKNSIRHNLSLHNRFMRVQNEGTGKSSWWMINPDAKPGKAARRRATSMETQKYEKKRGRVKKKVEALRNGLTLDTTPSPSSSVSEGLDMFPESPLHQGFQLSPDFRPRASSNASSCGRLSPIPVEPDLHDSQVPPLSPLSSWNSDVKRLYSTNDAQEQLAELANTMKIGGGTAFLNVTKTSPTSQSSPSNSNGNLNASTFSTLSNYSYSTTNTTSSGLTRTGSDPFFQTSIENNITLTSLNTVTGRKSPSRILSGDILSTTNYTVANLSPSLSPSQSMDTLPSGSTTNFNSPQHQNTQTRVYSCLDNNTIIRNVINCTPKVLESQSASTLMNATTLLSSNTITSLGTTASHVMGHLLSLNNSLPNDLDLNLDSLQGGLECDVDQVIRHELSVDGNLDFNFDPMHNHNPNSASTGVPTSIATAAAVTSSHSSWVH